MPVEKGHGLCGRLKTPNQIKINKVKELIIDSRGHHEQLSLMEITEKRGEWLFTG